MFSRWSIRSKFRLGLAMLVVIVLTLFGSAYYGLYAYRDLVRSLSARADEFPLANDISQAIAGLRSTLVTAQVRLEPGRDGAVLAASLETDPQLLREEYKRHIQTLEEALQRYQDELKHNSSLSNDPINDNRAEIQDLKRLQNSLNQLHARRDSQDWLLAKPKLTELAQEVDRLADLAERLPAHLHSRMHVLADRVKSRYRTAIVMAWVSTALALILLSVFVRMFRKWIGKPLGALISASRHVANGHYEHRIHLESRDEMSELAESMNAMTEQFQEVRADLDEQVRQRTRQVVRAEQLASVGYLAAGVAHEINNPLASIAMCSESLEGRLDEIFPHEERLAAHRELFDSYLGMIQQEAFRCKEITGKLLDFSRAGGPGREPVDLHDLIAGVIEMVGHLGKYHEKEIVLEEGRPVIADVNAQEMKQVVLNLLTNALDSVDTGGRVTISISKRGSSALVEIVDNGCGMTEEVRKHLFEPFFTRRRGGQGIGLGLSITYRIVSEHDGTIDVHSDGPGTGSQFTVTLPLVGYEKEQHHRYEAA